MMAVEVAGERYLTAGIVNWKTRLILFESAKFTLETAGYEAETIVAVEH